MPQMSPINWIFMSISLIILTSIIKTMNQSTQKINMNTSFLISNKKMSW